MWELNYEYSMPNFNWTSSGVYSGYSGTSNNANWNTVYMYNQPTQYGNALNYTMWDEAQIKQYARIDDGWDPDSNA